MPRRTVDFDFDFDFDGTLALSIAPLDANTAPQGTGRSVIRRTGSRRCAGPLGPRDTTIIGRAAPTAPTTPALISTGSHSERQH